MYVHPPALALWQAPSIALLTNVLLAPCRLTSLPPGVLWLIARKMGRRSRTVSRALLAAFGPLDCGLVISGSAAFGALQRVLGGGSWQRLQQAKSLQLTQLDWGEECGADLVASIVTTLPHLEYLKLPTGPSELALRARLAPLCTLTALNMRCSSCPTAGAWAEGLTQLTGLRSLIVRGPTPEARDMVAWQHVLGSLPQLQRLRWFADRSIGVWTPQWLAGLGSRMPHLTSLSLGQSPAPQHAWDACATAALRQALTGVRSLSFNASARGDSAAAVDAAFTGLSQCTWLELHLDLLVDGPDPAPNLLQLSSLRLASLDLAMEFSAVGPLMRALQAQAHLTKLLLRYYDCPFEACVPQLPSTLVELRLVDGPASLMPLLQALPSLRLLSWCHNDNSRGAAPAAAQLSKLTQLHALSIATWSLPPALLPSLGRLTALRKLRLDQPDPYDASRPALNVTDRDLMQLVPLRELTRLVLRVMHEVTASGLLALLEALPHLQRLELADILTSEVEAEALVEGLLPRVLPRLTHLQLVNVWLPGHAQAALLSAAEAHDCRCVVS
jgi:hypothetical protein